MYKNKKAFTLTEIVIGCAVVLIVGMMFMIFFVGGDSQKPIDKIINMNYLEYNSTINVSFTGTSICSLNGFVSTVPLNFSLSTFNHSGDATPSFASTISLNS